MPTVPVAENRVGIAEVSGAKFQAADFSAGSQEIGAGLQRVGAATSQLAEVEHVNKVRFADASAKDGDNQLMQFVATNGHTGPNAFFNLGGKDVIAAQPGFERAITDKVSEIRGQLKDPWAKAMFDRTVQARQAQWTAEIGDHANKATTQYALSEGMGRIDNAKIAAGNVALIHPEEAENNIATMNNETTQLLTIQHVAPEEITAKIFKQESSLRHDIGVTILNSGENGIATAQGYLDKYNTRLTPDDRASLQTNIRTMTNAQAAEQRRQEADARRDQNEEKRAAGERASDVLRQLDTGTPLPPATMAAAERDAEVSGRPALSFGIKQAGFKNGLNVQWRDSTPTDIQNRLNELGPQIAKAGDKADIKDVTEFQHLTSLRNASATALAHDPISWGAEHLGMNVGKLDFHSQDSINQRLNVARVVSDRTGAPLKVMTDDEASAFAPIVASGSVADRRGLVTKLASFGALGPSAAAQVAPNNDQFVSLVGLAGGASRSASNAHVEWAINGAEILKTNPKLMKNEDAARLFQQHVGGALDLLPSVARGVSENSRSIFAAKANAAGASDWNHAADQYPAAVNDALGAFRDNGVMKGGIGKWQGRATLLPDGWSQQQFDNTIARANVAQLRNGWNGQPADARGNPLTVGQLKSMQYVAVGDGRYRLTDGSHYVGKKGGGFLEIDIRRVR